MSTTIQPGPPRQGMSAKTKAQIELWSWAVAAFLTWHLSLVVTAGQNIRDILDTWRGLFSVLRGGSVTAVAGHGPIPEQGPITVWIILLVLFFGLRFGVTMWLILRKKKKKSGRAPGPALNSHKEIVGRIEGKGNLELVDAPMTLEGKAVPLRREDTGAGLSVPRGGKSSRMVIPKVVETVGALVTTSTRPDVMRATILHRSKKGHCFVADFDGLTNWPDKLKWDLVAGCEDPKVAIARAGGMVNAMPSGTEDSASKDHFSDGCRKIIRALLHAAALKKGGTMRDVMYWAAHFENEEPAKIIAAQSTTARLWKNDLDQWCRKDNPKTIGNTRTTLFRVLDPMMVESVLAMLCPAEDEPQLNITDFCQSNDTLYCLVDDDSAMGTAPLVTALVESIATEGQALARKNPNGRLTSGLTFLLDEVTNVCPIPSLPKQMTTGGGSGLHTWLWAQGYGQLEERYGKKGAETIFFTGASAKVVFGGSGEIEFLRRVSDLIGSHYVDHQTTSTTVDQQGDPQVSTSLSRQLDVKMRPEEIRKLPEDTALLLYRELEAIVSLTPWWERSDAAQFQASLDWCAQKEGTQAQLINELETEEAVTA